MRRFGILVATLLTLAMAQLAVAAGDITITMDDLPFQPVNGLVHPTGVQFGFTVGGLASLDANYAAGGPGSTTFVQDPSIEGTTEGVLSIVFPTPASIVKFGVARSITLPIATGAAVELFNAANVSLGVTNLPFSPLVSYSEAQFSYSGVGVKRARVNFTTSFDGIRFAFDNLTFRPVPEPASVVLSMLGGLFIATMPRRRSNRTTGVLSGTPARRP